MFDPFYTFVCENVKNMMCKMDQTCIFHINIYSSHHRSWHILCKIHVWHDCWPSLLTLTCMHTWGMKVDTIFHVHPQVMTVDTHCWRSILTLLFTCIHGRRERGKSCVTWLLTVTVDDHTYPRPKEIGLKIFYDCQKFKQVFTRFPKIPKRVLRK